MPAEMPIRTMRWSGREEPAVDPLLTREWLVTNGLGGYASGTVAGVATRRYHGLLVAALPSPMGRMMMHNHLTELVHLPDGRSARIGGREHPGRLALHGTESLTEFRLEAGLPVWRFNLDGVAIEKSIVLPHRQNTAHVLYRMVSGQGTVRLRLRPSLKVRPHDAPVNDEIEREYRLSICGNRYEIDPGGELPTSRLYLWGRKPALLAAPGKLKGLFYRVEARRGYPERGDLWSPGDFLVDLRPDRPAYLTVSVEDWDHILALPPEESLAAERDRRARLIQQADPRAREGLGAELVLAADQFLISPATRTGDAARALASGVEPRSVIAGYHWFTDWGRDTMISLEGLTLSTGRLAEGGYILRTFAQAVRDGLIPNLYPEGSVEGVYHTADATLWFFHALDRYVRASDDRATLRLLLPKMLEIVDRHREGTRFGIGVDPSDGLLRQGEEGYQLTWMDAKVEGWVVTPRRGKAVEINALWYNALRLLEGWLRNEGRADESGRVAAMADRVRASFNRRFWYEAGGHLYDVVDGEQGDDPACRPNQLFAISLPHPVLDESRWQPVVELCRERLLTPVGLRSLAPGHPDYKPYYDGDLRARDAAYHQGTVWAWLIGPFVDAWLKVHPEDRAGTRRFLEGFEAHLGEACIGSISEIFDAESPFTPRGCVAQAWSVAEALRCWVATA
jgi:predicted glycogen debranching enzyme